jgi:hypothetical protein
MRGLSLSFGFLTLMGIFCAILLCLLILQNYFSPYHDYNLNIYKMCLQQKAQSQCRELGEEYSGYKYISILDNPNFQCVDKNRIVQNHYYYPTEIDWCKEVSEYAN